LALSYLILTIPVKKIIWTDLLMEGIIRDWFICMGRGYGWLWSERL